MNAIEYNVIHAPALFLDQTTWKPVKPATPAGVERIKAFQAACGVAVDGKLGPSTQAALVARYGPLDMERHCRHVIPFYISRWGYDHAHRPEETRWPHRGVGSFAALTGQGRVVDGLLRLVCHCDPKAKTAHRTPWDAAGIDTLSLGLAHVWAENIPEFVSWLVSEAPREATLAWGGYLDCVASEDRLKALLGDSRADGPIPFRFAHLVAGWWQFARHERVMRLQCQWWLDHYADHALEYAKFLFGSELDKSNGARLLAGIARMFNSGPARAGQHLDKARDLLGPSASAEAVVKKAFDHGLYGHPDRWTMIQSMPQFSVPAPKTLAF